MKKIIIFIVLTLNILYADQCNKILEQEKITDDNYIVCLSNEYNKEFNKSEFYKISEGLILYSSFANSDEKKISYNYIYMNDKSNINTLEYRKAFKEQIEKIFCFSGVLNTFFKNNFISTFKLYDNNFNNIINFSLEKDYCNTNQ